MTTDIIVAHIATGFGVSLIVFYSGQALRLFTEIIEKTLGL